MGIRADESHAWGPDNPSTTVQSIIILPENNPKPEKAEESHRSEAKLLVVQSNRKRRLPSAKTRANHRKASYRESDLSGEGLDGNPMLGTSLE